MAKSRYSVNDMSVLGECVMGKELLIEIEEEDTRKKIKEEEEQRKRSENSTKEESRKRKTRGKELLVD